MKNKLIYYVFLLWGIILIIPFVACTGPQEQGSQLAPDVQWSQTFIRTEGIYGDPIEQTGDSVQQTIDGGYVICGTASYVDNNYDTWLIKTDEDGNKVWDKTFDSGSGHEVQQTADGGYIILGSTKRTDGTTGYDIWLMKTDTEGNKLWSKTFCGKGNSGASSLQQTPDGGYIICGRTIAYSADAVDLWLIKADEDGNKVWDKTFNNGWGTDVQNTTDGGYILCGNTEFKGAAKTDIWLIKTDTDGNKLWDHTFGGNGASSVYQTKDSGYVICGSIGSTNNRKILLIKTDAKGDKLWGKTFDGSLRITIGHSVQQTADSGYIVCGVTKSSGTLGTDWWLIKIDEEGNKIWEKTFDRQGSNWASANQITDGGYIICGGSGSYLGEEDNITLMKIAPDR